MGISGEDYLVSRNKKIERKKKLLAMVSVVSFVGSTVFAVIPLIQHAMQPQQPASVSPESSLQQQAKGYELVLQREPNNQVALEKLSLVRLQLKDIKGSMELLEKLVKQHPDRQDYQVVLKDINKRKNTENNLK